MAYLTFWGRISHPFMQNLVKKLTFTTPHFYFLTSANSLRSFSISLVAVSIITWTALMSAFSFLYISILQQFHNTRKFVSLVHSYSSFSLFPLNFYLFPLLLELSLINPIYGVIKRYTTRISIITVLRKN